VTVINHSPFFDNIDGTFHFLHFDLEFGKGGAKGSYREQAYPSDEDQPNSISKDFFTNI
jgi:hypothetical protein